MVAVTMVMVRLHVNSLEVQRKKQSNYSHWFVKLNVISKLWILVLSRDGSRPQSWVVWLNSEG